MATLVATAVLIAFADQVAKAIVVANLGVGERVSVLGRFIEIWHAQNQGAAFSLFQGGLPLFLVVTAIALGMIAYFHYSFRDRPLWLHALLGVVLGGSLGNLADRLRLGYVTDFVSVGIGNLRFPTFNVADASITVGIGLLLAYLWWTDPGRQRAVA